MELKDLKLQLTDVDWIILEDDFGITKTTSVEEAAKEITKQYIKGYTTDNISIDRAQKFYNEWKLYVEKLRKKEPRIIYNTLSEMMLKTMEMVVNHTLKKVYDILIAEGYIEINKSETLKYFEREIREIIKRLKKLEEETKNFQSYIIDDDEHKGVSGDEIKIMSDILDKINHFTWKIGYILLCIKNDVRNREIDEGNNLFKAHFIEKEEEWKFEKEEEE